MKSTPEEIQKAHVLVAQTEEKMKRLIAAGKRIHMIWDFDGVLASPLSEDIFELTGRNLERYFEYEMRLFLSPPGSGTWLPLAKKIGVLHASQDIVTAKSSFLAFRVILFCIWHSGKNLSTWMRWILPIGHQSKADSFRIILESLKKDPQTFIFFIDDTPKHITAFIEVSRQLEMAKRTAGIVAPKIREYTEEQLQWHYEAIMKAEGDTPLLIPGTPGGYTNGFVVFPNGLTGFRNIVTKNYFQAEQQAAIKKFGSLLEMTFHDLFPDEPVTPEGLHFAFHFLQEEAAHDTMMINEIMENEAHLGRTKGVNTKKMRGPA